MYEFKFLMLSFCFFVFLFVYMKMVNKKNTIIVVELMLSLILFIYSLPVAIAYIFGIDHFQLGEERVFNIYAGYIVCSVFILLGSYAHGMSSSMLNANKFRFESNPKEYRLVMFFVLISGLALYGTYLLLSYDSLTQMIQDTTREERFANSKGMGVFTSGIYLINFAWIFIFFNDVKNKNIRNIKFHILLLFFYIAFFSASGDRRVWVSLVIGMVFVWSNFNKIPIVKMIFFGFISLLLLQLFSKIRGYSYSLDEMFNFLILNFTYEWFDFSSGEFGWHYLIVSDIIDYVNVYGVEFGKTYIVAPFVSIPSFIYENKPTGLSPWYASIYFPDYFSNGGTLAFSFLAESYLNFSILGPVIVPLIFGYLVSFFLSLLKSILNYDLFISVCASLLSTVLIFARSDLSAVINQIVIAIVVPLLIFYFFKMVVKLLTVKILV